MEFTCVFSVNGSLAYYLVKKESDNSYVAELKTAQGNRADIPAEIRLEKTAGQWRAIPLHEDVFRSLIHAIEANHLPDNG